jgi:hypothetical protein
VEVEVEVEVEAEEVVEDVGVGQNNYEEPGPRGSAADLLLGEEMEGDPSASEVVTKMILMGHPVSSCHVPVVSSYFILFHTLISS